LHSTARYDFNLKISLIISGYKYFTKLTDGQLVSERYGTRIVWLTHEPAMRGLYVYARLPPV